jgi:acyl-CoA dehydrogenase
MNFGFTKEQQANEEKARKFASLEIAPIRSELEEDLELRQDIFQKMAKAGFLLMCLPKDHGEEGTDYISYVLSLKAIAAVDAGIAVAMSVTNMVAEAIATYGTEAQKEKYISRIRKGQGLPLAFALTEKESGSDAKSITTEAVIDPKNPQEYLINGSKQFITNADAAGVILVMAKTSKDQGAHGITAFLVDRETGGFKIVKKERKMGLLSANLVDFELENCRVSKDQILGDVGQGFEIAMHALDAGRMGISAQALGIAEAAYKEALKHAKERYQFGHPLAENQIIAFKLADMYVKLEAAYSLLYKACWLKDNGKDVNLAASASKVFCTEAAIEIVNEALQIFGGYGYVKDYPMERYYRDVRVTTLYEGTSEIQRLIISRALIHQEDMH